MTDDLLIQDLRQKLGDLPLLAAPAVIRERVAAEIRCGDPDSADVSAALASLPLMPAPPP